MNGIDGEERRRRSKSNDDERFFSFLFSFAGLSFVRYLFIRRSWNWGYYDDDNEESVCMHVMI